ncbi:MAG: SDR family NAD(P)-dependent oxidoreductase [Acidobacteriaceae bacterium]
MAIVTGGAGAGIGSGITEALAKRDWKVMMVDVDASGIAELQHALAIKGFKIDGMAMDITSDGAADEVVVETLKRYGRLDGLVNNAGVGLCKPVAEIEDEEFEGILDVDFRAVFRFCRAALRVMLPIGGSIVNIGSIHAHRSVAGYSVYAAIKSGLEAFTRGIAVDCGGQNIRANCVHPGLVMSPQNRALIEKFEPDVEGWLSSFAATKQLLPSLVMAGQVGDLVSFLLSSEAAAITGQSITIDAGSSAMLFDKKAGQ